MRKSIHSPEYETFLTQLRQARVDAGITQIELAETLDTTQSIVSKIERGERRLDAVELWHWCRALGASYADFTVRLDRSLRRGLRG